MKPFYRRILVFVIVVVILFGAYTIYPLIADRFATLPAEFSEARADGGIISEKIVLDSNEIATALAQLTSSTPRYAEASSTLGDVLIKVSNIREQAIELGAKLSIMTQAVPKVRSSEAQQVALESISQRLALVEHLIKYTDRVTELVGLLRLRLRDHAQNSQDISRLIGEANTEVNAINNFNRTANESMEKFDSLLR